MEFDYQTRRKYADKCLSDWEEQHSLKRKKLSSRLSELIKDIEDLGSSSNNRAEQVEQFWEDYKGEASLSAFMKKHCKPLVELYVPKEYLEDYYDIIDQFPNYQYTTGSFRRTVRTSNLNVHIKHAFRLLYSYMAFASYQATAADYLMDRLSPEALDFKRHDNYYGRLHLACFDDILAARINAGDAQVMEAVQEAFLSENNTVIVTSDIVRGVLKSTSKELHELLAKFLIAARLQEGVRQVVCENADCGLPEAFLTILDAISQENLIRFAAVKRAIATWTGVCDVENMDRITDKVFADIQVAVQNREEAKRMTDTNDSVQIMIGLWALGFYEVEDALAVMEHIAQNGTKNQLLTISYYNRMVQDSERTRRIATQIFEQYSDDYELLAAYMPTYMEGTDYYVRESARTKDGRSYSYNDVNEEYTYKSVPVTYLFDNEEKARKHYEILKHACQSMKKRKQEYRPCIFPWYGVTLERSDFVARMSLIAYALQDQALIDEVCGMLSNVDGTYSRRQHIRMLLHDPKTEIQRQALISYIADKETYSRETAYAILSSMTLSDKEYEQLEGYLKYKTEAIRQFVIKLLEKRSDEDLQKSVERLLQSGQENMRLAGLDIIKKQCEQHPEKRERYVALVQSRMEDGDTFNEQEKVLLEEITNKGGASEILCTEGYGLYDPKVVIQLPEQRMNQKVLADYFSLSKKELDCLFRQLTAFIDEHAKDEYTNVEGETRLLGNGLEMIVRDYRLPADKQYPFPELWQEFYKTYIKTPKTFWNMYMAIEPGYDSSQIKDIQEFQAAEQEVFPVCSSVYEIPDKKYISMGFYKRNMLMRILTIIRCQQEPELPMEVAVQACLYAAALPENRKWYEKPERKDRSFWSDNTPLAFVESQKFGHLSGRVSQWKDDSEFAETFYTLYRLDEAYQFQKMQKEARKYYARQQQSNYLSMYSYIKAYTLGLIPADLVYRYAFETLGLSLAVEQLGCFMKETLTILDLRHLENYMQVDLDKRTVDTESKFYQAGKEFYQKIVDTILDVELKRGDSATVFSEAVKQITCVYGLNRLMAILTALGRDTLDRSTYYYWSSDTGKRGCLSHLLQVCHPLAEDTAEQLAREIKQKKISKERLIETAMYAPQWLDLVQEYLGCDGFKSGCYYFMAHMNERFDDKKKAMIAKYTPLTPEELNAGCFDVDWFFEAYEKLGEDMFSKLYKAAKYISDGNKHARARKYADAALGKVTREELEQTIDEKRNKDLLMSYGILPVVDEADQLHRYEYLQEFLKESKQFGAQRRASEAKCVEVALKNLATTAGYADDLRLILAMETALVTSNADYFEGVRIGEYECKIIVNAQGKAELCIQKAGKKLKSVPAAIKKDEAYLAIREFATKLKNQYSRCVQMFERAMEEREYYTYGELQKLCRNPVTKAILTNLVYVIPGVEDETNAVSDMEQEADMIAGIRLGVLSETGEGMKDVQGHGISLEANQKLRVAHPYDLYRTGCWAEYQKLFFTRQQETGRKQPFKQVFRELYVKLPEEAEADKSRMFAGNQIQPAKTVAALKNRRWVADYENGLQKIYYKENIIATIYAMADWFSPADTEEPTLEYVVFYDRKTFRQMKLFEVPDIVYSEVMRDTDLAVSVAHAGGVDPLTSHSTIEMRKVIVQFNLELFKLKNVTLEGNHAFVKGKYAEYSIHLGSGVIHQVGGHQINVLPVHSQNRGKIFLPFIDDDPKTAEIMAKVLLFAQDQKIKDPYIMEQIVF